MERAFDVLDDNLEDIHRGGASSRATEIRLAGGTVETAERTDLNIYAENAANSSDNETFTISPRPVMYTSPDGDTHVTYENGAVVRSDRDSHVMKSEPEWLLPGDDRVENTTVLPMISTVRQSDSASTGGGSTILLVAYQRSTNFGSFASDDGVEVTVTIESPRADAWERYLEERDVGTVSRNGDEVEYTFATERLYVPETSIGIEFSY